LTKKRAVGQETFTKTLLSQKQPDITGISVSKSVALLFALVFLTASCVAVKPTFSSADIVEDSWASKASMPQGKSGFGLAVVNGTIYAIGGYIQNYVSRWTRGFSGTSEVVSTNEEYDPALDRWIFKSPMPTPRHDFATIVYENSIYCIGGVKNILPSASVEIRTAAVEVFDLSTNKWENKTPMPTRRGGFATMVYKDNIYCIGEGINEVYNIVADTWQTKAPMPFNGSFITANVVNGKLYMTFDSLMYVYNPATDSWSTKASISTEKPRTVSAVIDNKIYVISSDLTQIYDVETDRVSLGASPPLAYDGGRACATTGEMAPKRIYILGETFQVYNPEADSWTIGAKLPTVRSNVSIAVVNEKIYVIGGNTATISPGLYPNYPDYSVTQHATNEEYTPFGYGTIPPVVSVISPENKTYVSSNVSLAFTVNKPALWMGYSLNGQDNVTITGNTTLAGLANGLHNVTVYAKDEFENTGASETITFTIAKETESFPIRLVGAVAIVVAAVVLVATVGVGLSAYLKKRK
jgi:predicted small secreted protein